MHVDGVADEARGALAASQFIRNAVHRKYTGKITPERRVKNVPEEKILPGKNLPGGRLPLPPVRWTVRRLNIGNY